MAASEVPAPGVAIVKRSLTVAGHRTSISLEDAFWSGLKSVAERRGRSVASLVAEVDDNRGNTNLSSALRVMVLHALSTPMSPTPESPADRAAAQAPE